MIVTSKQQETDNFISHIKDSFLKKENCDVIANILDEQGILQFTFPLHTLLLSRISYFRNLFSGKYIDSIENKKDVYTINLYILEDGKVGEEELILFFSLFYEYNYENIKERIKRFLLPVHYLCMKFGFEDAVDKLESWIPELIDSMNVENILEYVLHYPIKNNYSSLIQYINQWMKALHWTIHQPKLDINVNNNALMLANSNKDDIQMHFYFVQSSNQNLPIDHYKEIFILRKDSNVNTHHSEKLSDSLNGLINGRAWDLCNVKLNEENILIRLHYCNDKLFARIIRTSDLHGRRNSIIPIYIEVQSIGTQRTLISLSDTPYLQKNTALDIPINYDIDTPFCLNSLLFKDRGSSIDNDNDKNDDDNITQEKKMNVYPFIINFRYFTGHLFPSS